MYDTNGSRGKPGGSINLVVGTVLTHELISVLNQASDDLHRSFFLS